MKRSFDAYSGKSNQAHSLSSALNKRSQITSGTNVPALTQASSVRPKFDEWPAFTGISDPLHDRGSIFIGYYAPLETSAEASRLLAKVKKSPVADGIDHVMSAWRVYADGTGTGGQRTLDAFTSQGSNQRQVITGGDDDGERFSSEKLISLLAGKNLFGLMICTRVYGGQMLGQARFEHITRVCRDAHTISQNQRILAQRAQQSGEAERARLLRLIKAKDLSIASLRASLAARSSQPVSKEPVPVEPQRHDLDKTSETPLFAAEEPASQSSRTLSPPTTPKQSSQTVSQSVTPKTSAATLAEKPIETLKRLVTARDLTIQTLRNKLQASPVKSPGGPVMLMTEDVTASQQKSHNASLFLSDDDS